MTADTFDRAYAALTPEQKQAVDTVEGPVMVLAGPGTGKTHILTLRVANILQKTSAKPDEILVLTFTDSAARTLSRRLAALIGDEAARKVGIFTFHTFAAEMVRRHPEAFSEYADRRQMDEIEQVLLWRDILETRGDPRLATPKSPFHYLKDLRNLEEDLTRECFSLDAYRAWLDTEEERFKEDSSLHYVRGEKGGELKPAGIKKIARLEKGRAAIKLIETYRTEKDARGLYGFTDILRYAVDGLAEDDALRADVQEQYQYVLADEHQDANALQHALLDALAFDEHPNLFIVGDEKQAVFGFQGADVSHFAIFLKRYPRATKIALTKNYRSHQEILNLAQGLLIELPSAAGGHAELTAARGAGARVHVLTASDPLAEREAVAELVETAITEGVPPHEIAVITHKNKTADLFVPHLHARGIKALRAGEIDLYGRPIMRVLLALMRAVADPIDTASLRQALLAPWWEVPLAERAHFLRETSNRELVARIAEVFPDVAKQIEELQHQALEMPPFSLFSHLLAVTGVRTYLLTHAEAFAEDVPLVRQLMLAIEGLVARNPNAIFADILDEFEKAREHEVATVKTSHTEVEGYVSVLTAHKAKGMEFSRVFVTALTKAEWEGRGTSARIPSPFDAMRTREELVRLFYVALTRAKDALVLSYAAENGDGRAQTPMSLMPTGLPKIDVTTDPLPQLSVPVDASELVRELTRRYLTRSGLSPSAYNEYLESPATFFVKRVLRLSEPETRAIAIGNAVHAALAAYLSTDKKGEERTRREAARIELVRSFKRSLLPRGDAFDALVRHASMLVEGAFKDPFFLVEPIAIEESFKTTRTIGGTEVILKGKIDALIPTTAGPCIIDFKTSSQIKKEDREKFGRQISFYDLLLRANGHESISGKIVRLSEEGVEEHDVVLTDAMREAFSKTLDDVLSELLESRWRSGSPSDYDALLQLLV